jgi:sugar lactone lactonase YvrE
MRAIGGLVVLLALAAPAAAQDTPLSDILLPGEGWKKVEGKFKSVAGLAVDKEGRLYIADFLGKRIYRINTDGKIEEFSKTAEGLALITVGPDGTIYGLALADEKRPFTFVLARLGEKGRLTPLASLTDYAQDTDILDVTEEGEVRMLIRPPPYGDPSAKLVRYDRDGNLKSKQELSPGVGHGAVLWPDKGTLVKGGFREACLWAFRFQPDGTLADGEKYYRLERQRGKKEAAIFLTIDRQGRVYASTPMGLQVLDPTGRLSGILASPVREPPGLLDFAGPNRNLLYATFGMGVFNTLYVRKMKAQGVPWPEKKPAPKDK